jgi:ATP-dependent Clp protease, protease subunit
VIPRLQTFADGPELWHDWARRELLESRTVLLQGPLHEDHALAASAELMLLDGEGDEAVQLRIESEGGTLDGALMLVDVIDLLGVPVQATCMGRLEGAAVAAFAVAPTRVLGAHARIRLSEPRTAYEDCRAAELAVVVAHHRTRVEQFVACLAEATGQPTGTVADDLRRGRFLTAQEAVDLGYADEVAGPEAEIRRFPRRVGYRLR